MKYKFNGYYDTPYYGDGEFTIGMIYEPIRITNYRHSEPDALFIDDNGGDIYEDLKYFTLVKE